MIDFLFFKANNFFCHILLQYVIENTYFEVHVSKYVRHLHTVNERDKNEKMIAFKNDVLKINHTLPNYFLT